MSNKKKCQVVILATEKDSIIFNYSTSPLKPRLGLVEEIKHNIIPFGEDKKVNMVWSASGGFQVEDTDGKFMELYIISDDEIKEGYYYNISNKEVFYVSKTQLKFLRKDNCKYIIASTDKSLNLPTISKEFIEIYIEEYNKNKPIVDVNVEYEIEEHNTNSKYDFPKLDNNEILITKIEEKESYTHKEMCENMQYYMEYVQANKYVTPMKWLRDLKHF